MSKAKNVKNDADVDIAGARKKIQKPETEEVKVNAYGIVKAPKQEQEEIKVVIKEQSDDSETEYAKKAVSNKNKKKKKKQQQ